MHDVRWLAVVPLKPLATAKSRLRGALPGVSHERLVLAMMLDTVTAIVACPRVALTVVVCDDAAARSAAVAAGARAVPDTPAAGLNAALVFGAAEAGARRTLGGPVAALTADLPALRPGELASAPDAAAEAGGRVFVPDTAGSGTVLLAAPSAAELSPAFGARSATVHAASGARRLRGDWPGLRRDVDRVDDLATAAALGLGRHTAGLLTASGVGSGADGRPPDRGADLGAGTVWGMRTLQGTVATFDSDTEAGTVLLDDGSEVGFSPAAFAAGGLLMLRLGQRVHMECSDDGTVTRITLVTMP